MPQTFQLIEDRQHRTLRLIGELDLACAGDLMHQIETAAATWGATAILFDLSELTFIDSVGVHALVAGSRRGGVTCILELPSPRIARVLRILGVDQIADVEIRVDGSSPGLSGAGSAGSPGSSGS